MCVDDLFSFFLEFHHSSKSRASIQVKKKRTEAKWKKEAKKKQNANEPVLWGPSYRTVVNIYVYNIFIHSFIHAPFKPICLYLRMFAYVSMCEHV